MVGAGQARTAWVSHSGPLLFSGQRAVCPPARQASSWPAVSLYSLPTAPPLYHFPVPVKLTILSSVFSESPEDGEMGKVAMLSLGLSRASAWKIPFSSSSELLQWGFLQMAVLPDWASCLDPRHSLETTRSVSALSHFTHLSLSTKGSLGQVEAIGD